MVMAYFSLKGSSVRDRHAGGVMGQYLDYSWWLWWNPYLQQHQIFLGE